MDGTSYAMGIYQPLRSIKIPSFALSSVSAPATEPITLTQAKSQCRVPAALTDDDQDLTDYIVAAREYCEKFLGRRLITQTWDISFDTFPYARYGIEIPYGPLQSVTSVKYYDSNGTQQTMSAALYVVDAASFAPRIYPAWAQIWPVIRPIPLAVTIRAVVGFGAQAAIPSAIVQAIKLLVAHWFANREMTLDSKPSDAPVGVDTLLSQERESWI